MAEIILAVLCLIVGAISVLGVFIVLWANAMGGVTNATAVNNWPALWLAIIAIVAFGASVALFL